MQFFDLGIQLKRVEIISDVESEIVEAVTRMSKEYDIVISSGGIGPTHDDITFVTPNLIEYEETNDDFDRYSSIAAAFSGGKLEYDKETISRMHTMNSRVRGPQTDEQIEARNRMALFPVNGLSPISLPLISH